MKLKNMISDYNNITGLLLNFTLVRKRQIATHISKQILINVAEL